jgi:hypothetical protein
MGSATAVRNYTVAGDHSVVPYRYCVYLELEDESRVVSQDCAVLAAAFDRELQVANLSYKTLARSNHRLAPAVLKLVTGGTFASLEDDQYRKGNGVSRNQIKVPRVVSDPAQIQLLEERVVLGQLNS